MRIHAYRSLGYHFPMYFSMFALRWRLIFLRQAIFIRMTICHTVRRHFATLRHFRCLLPGNAFIIFGIRR